MARSKKAIKTTKQTREAMAMAKDDELPQEPEGQEPSPDEGGEDLPVVIGRNGKPRSRSITQRAIREYGENLTGLRYLLFAKLASGRGTQRDAYLTCFPEAKEATIGYVDTQASILMAHPKMQELIRAHTLGFRNTAAAIIPVALDRLCNIIQSGKDTDAIKAIIAAADRGGLPPVKEFTVSSYS